MGIFWDGWVFWKHLKLSYAGRYRGWLWCGVAHCRSWWISCLLCKTGGFAVHGLLYSVQFWDSSTVAPWNSDTLLMMPFPCFLCLRVPALASSIPSTTVQFSLPLTFTMFIPLTSHSPLPVLTVILPCGCCWNTGNASYARTVVPKYVLCRGNSAPGEQHCARTLCLLWLPCLVVAYSSQETHCCAHAWAGTEPPAGWRCGPGAGLSAIVP